MPQNAIEGIVRELVERADELGPVPRAGQELLVSALGPWHDVTTAQRHCYELVKAVENLRKQYRPRAGGQDAPDAT